MQTREQKGPEIVFELQNSLESESHFAEVGIGRQHTPDVAFPHHNKACQVGERNSWFVLIPQTQLPCFIEAIWIDTLNH